MTFARYVSFPVQKKGENGTSSGYLYSLVGLWMKDHFDGEVNCASSCLAIEISFFPSLTLLMQIPYIISAVIFLNLGFNVFS